MELAAACLPQQQTTGGGGAGCTGWMNGLKQEGIHYMQCCVHEGIHGLVGT